MEKTTQIKRPFIFNVTSIIAVTYHLVFLLIFASGIFFNKLISLALQDYFPTEISQSSILYFCIFGVTTYLISITGLIYLRKMKRIGLILFISSTVIYFIIKMLVWDISFVNVMIHIVFIFIFSFFIKSLN